MIVRGITQAKAEMESLVDAVDRDEEVIITRWGKTIAKMVGFDQESNQPMLSQVQTEPAI